MTALGRLFESYFGVIPEPVIGSRRSVLQSGLEAAVRCTVYEGPVWAVHVDLAGGASGRIMQRRRMSGSCPEFKDFKPASAPIAARSGL